MRRLTPQLLLTLALLVSAAALQGGESLRGHGDDDAGLGLAEQGGVPASGVLRRDLRA